MLNKKSFFRLLFLLIGICFNIYGSTTETFTDNKNLTIVNASEKIQNFSGIPSVNQGKFNYAISINLPEGIKGLIPTLSLTYDSNSTGFKIGKGWDLDGISEIYRYNNSQNKIVYDNSDTFYLDGQALVPISGANGYNGTEYRTYNNSFSKIISYTSNNQKGPEKFKVWTKSGLIYEYGYVDGSKQVNKTYNVSYSWKVNKVTDQNNNVIDYSYLTGNKSGYPLTISYNGNKIKILYIIETTSDTVDSVSLFGISIVDDNQKETLYKLDYQFGTGVNKYLDKRLKQIQFCKSNECLNPITFTWTSDNTKINKITDNVDTTTIIYNTAVGDKQNLVSSMSTVNSEVSRFFEYNYKGTVDSKKLFGEISTTISSKHPYLRDLNSKQCNYISTDKYYFNTNSSLDGLVKENTTTDCTNNMFESNSYEYVASKQTLNYYNIALKNTISKKYLDGKLISTTTANQDYDDYGNLKLINTTFVGSDGKNVTSKITSTYDNDTSNWRLGKLKNQVIEKTSNNQTDTQNITYTYDASKSSQINKITTVLNDKRTLSKSFTYDSFGNVIGVTLSGSDVKNDRTTTYKYLDSSSLDYMINPEGHKTSYKYDSFGNLNELVDSNNLSTKFTYDTFGRKIKEIYPNGLYVDYKYSLSTEATNSFFKVVATYSNGVTTSIYYDITGKEVRRETIGFGGKKINKDKIYNKKGLVEKESLSYFSGNFSQYFQYTYDNMNRIVNIIEPTPEGRSSLNTISYNGLVTTTTNPLSQRTVTTKDSLGQITKIDESSIAQQTYSYDINGKLLTTIDTVNNKIDSLYSGSTKTVTDPDMGKIIYTYNVFGELVSKTDAKSQTTSYVYDRLGRVLEINSPEGKTSYIYDTKKKGLISLESKTNYQKEYFYDSLSRVIKTIVTIDGNKVFTKEYTYNTNGQIDTITEPNNFKIKYDYDSQGNLQAIKSPKEMIEDFDPNHFLTLIKDTLQGQIEFQQKANEYIAKANEYRAKALKYSKIADIYAYSGNRDALNYLRNVADTLNEYAKIFEDRATYYQGMANYYQKLGSQYLSQSIAYISVGSRFRRRTVAVIINSYYYQLAQIYLNYSNTLANIAYNNLVVAQIARENIAQDDDVDILNSSFTVIISTYQAKAKEALADATESQAKAVYYQNMAKNYKVDTNVLSAYQDMLADSKYVYHYKVLDRDSSNRVTKYISGNGLVNTQEYGDAGELKKISAGFTFDDKIRDLEFTYDELFNVKRRVDNVLGTTQDYTYDSLNRVTNEYITTQNGTKFYNYQYNSLGNITYKSDVGSYIYDSQKPHQVIKAGNRVFKYDANGNQLYNNGTSIEYTSSNLAKKITYGGKNTLFLYDTQDNRYKKQTDSTTSYYVDKTYENVQYGSNISEDKYFIYADGVLVSIYTNRYENQTKIPSSKYFHYDNLNSIDTITDNEGEVLQRFVYKAFGEEEVLDSDGDKTTQKAITNRGYTGHEHIDNTPFIHMNARVYDPIIGRFTSADSVIDGVYTTQGFNRYSYVKNNPLNYTDPSGHWGIKSVVKAVKKAVSQVVSTVVVTPIKQTVNESQRFESKHRDELKTAAIIGVGIYTGGAAYGALGTTTELGVAVAHGALAGAAAGAASGFTAGTLYHQDASTTMKLTFNGAKAGAISGAIAGGVTNLVQTPDTAFANKLLLRVTTGGLQSAILHQDVEQGMMFGALGSLGDIKWSSSNTDTWYGSIADTIDKAYTRSGLKEYIGDPFMKYLWTPGYNFYKNNAIGIHSSINSVQYNQYKYGDLNEL
ncbi:MAG: hypothetical protein PHF17_06190 [Arcobacteraceae bacterium]|nr:hypothetical protein [Arcobacteraceae bacterium]